MKNHQLSWWKFISCLEKSLSKKGLIKMVNVIKQEVRMEKSLRKRLEFICEFCRVKPVIVNGNLRTIDKTNFTYLEPYRIIINDMTFLAFNYSNDIFIENLNNKIKLS